MPTTVNRRTRRQRTAGASHTHPTLIEFEPNRTRLSRFVMLAKPSRCISFRVDPRRGIMAINEDTVHLRPVNKDFGPVQHFLEGYVEISGPGLGVAVKRKLRSLRRHGGDIQLKVDAGGRVTHGAVKVRDNPPAGEEEPYITIMLVERTTQDPAVPVSICPCDVGLDENEG